MKKVLSSPGMKLMMFSLNCFTVSGVFAVPMQYARILTDVKFRKFGTFNNQKATIPERTVDAYQDPSTRHECTRKPLV